MVLGVHFGPVRSDAAAPDTRKTLFFVAHDVVHGQRHRGRRHVDDHVDLIDIKPLAGNGRADVWLVLVIGPDDLDLQSLLRGTNVLDRHARGRDCSRPGDIGIEAGHIVHDADLDDAVSHLLSASRAAGQHRGEKCNVSN